MAVQAERNKRSSPTARTQSETSRSMEGVAPQGKYICRAVPWEDTAPTLTAGGKQFDMPPRPYHAENGRRSTRTGTLGVLRMTQLTGVATTGVYLPPPLEGRSNLSHTMSSASFDGPSYVPTFRVRTSPVHSLDTSFINPGIEMG